VWRWFDCMSVCGVILVPEQLGRTLLTIGEVIMFKILLIRYSDSLRAEQARDRIPAMARLYAVVQTGPGSQPAPCTFGTGSLPCG